MDIDEENFIGSFSDDDEEEDDSEKTATAFW